MQLQRSFYVAKMVKLFMAAYTLQVLMPSSDLLTITDFLMTSFHHLKTG